MISSARGLPIVRGLFVYWMAFGCGSSSAPEPKPTPAPTPPPPTISTDAVATAPPTLSPALRTKWEHGCFMLRTAGGLIEETDHARCTMGRRPYSTFKLANSLIAVDAGVLDGPDAPMTWDKQAIPDEKKYLDAWRKDHTLRSAIKVSSVPHFRTLARTIGEARMKAGLAKLDYGNQNIGGGLDKFWLSGDIRISAEQQLAFVDKLANGELAVSAKAQAVVREISTLETKGTRVLHGKTGSGPGSDRDPPASDYLVWQVGWIEDGTTIVPYAAWLEVTGGTFDDARAKRDALLRETLAALGAF